MLNDCTHRHRVDLMHFSMQQECLRLFSSFKGCHAATGVFQPSLNLCNLAILTGPGLALVMHKRLLHCTNCLCR